MLAAKVDGSISSLRFPLLASPKLDGIRAMIIDGKVYSRSMKLIPNAYVQACFGSSVLNGLDGELILGDPRHPDAFRNTTSAVMSHEGRPDVQFHVFDMWNQPLAAFHNRLMAARAMIHSDIVPVEHIHVYSENDVLALEESYLAQGYEGVMLRDPTGKYKQGRSTLREGGLVKLKRFHDSEALVVSMIELMHNDNEAKPDERGFMKRSSHQENKRPAGKMGALSVMDMTTKVQFEIGTGFTDADRVALWENSPVGKIIKYRYFPTGSKDKPRFPTFVGFRSLEDL
jgi:DNA ligase-1